MQIHNDTKMKIFFLFILIPCCCLAQPIDYTGSWKGTVSTNQKQLPYEVVLSMEEGTLTGFGYLSFDVKGSEQVAMKKLQIKVAGNHITLQDEDLLFSSLLKSEPKKIKQKSELVYTEEEGKKILSGSFETTGTRTLKPAKGKVYLEKILPTEPTALMVKLTEMDLKKDLSFIKKIKTDSLASLAYAEEMKESFRPVLTQSKFNSYAKMIAAKKAMALPLQKNKKPATGMAKAKIAIAAPVPAMVKAVPKPPVTPVVVAKEKAVPAVAQTKVLPGKNPPADAPKTVVAKTPAPLTPANKSIAAQIDLSKRRIETIENLYIKSDSLQMTLYDNGEVDGDTVSIILNGVTIVSKQGLDVKPFTKSFYLTPDLGDTLQFVMYAENLGSIPPNTGLLILNFDNQRHEIRFSGDLNKNAAIKIIRRKEE